ncbi:hypothetical protein FRAHR75_330040 [Frankia sp. Hr75.2]|nr:hypothetical protein FRAHR75_330040 [Frankia sp. Hr75.2]
MRCKSNYVSRMRKRIRTREHTPLKVGQFSIIKGYSHNSPRMIHIQQGILIQLEWDRV